MAAGEEASCGAEVAPAKDVPPQRFKLTRLLKRRDFLRAAGAGRKWAAPGLVLQAYRRRPLVESAGVESAGVESAGKPSRGRANAIGSDAEEIRFGLTVSKKVGNAVERNRVRRRLRAMAKEILPRLGERGTDYVLIGRAAGLTRSFPDLRRDLEQALKRVSGPETPQARRRRAPKRGAARRGSTRRRTTGESDEG